MKQKPWIALSLCIALLCGSAGTAFAAAPEDVSAAQTAIVNLKTEGRTDPIGIDTQQPAFSWQMQSQEIGAAQTAYRIVVCDEEEHVVWDSGEIESAKSNEILYEGEPLEPAVQYTWQVTVTDQDGT